MAEPTLGAPEHRRFRAILALALVGGGLSGVLAGLTGLYAALSGEWMSAGMCFLGAGVAFGLLANALLRR